jgi:hypothetical protein
MDRLVKVSLLCKKIRLIDRGWINALTILAMLVLSFPLAAQNWEFAKEKNGIKVYTRKEAGENVKSFRGIMEIRSTMERVNHLVGNVHNTEWWDENVKNIQVLYYEENKHFIYYLVYDVPWPLSDRDLCVEAIVTTDPVTGKREINARPLEGKVPEKEDLVRIKNYHQRWIITPLKNGMIRLELEGSVDPGGSVPAWLYNMVITDTPIRVMNGIKEKVEMK